MYVEQFFVKGLGHASYLIGSEGEGAVVDPRRDIDVYLAAARAENLRLRYIFETHNHNDFISGARQLAAVTGATFVASATAGLHGDHHPASDGDEFRVGALVVRTLFTPGHTPEHVSYTVADTSRADAPVLVFTGGDLLVGAVGRPDLLGRELGERLAPQLFDSLHNRLLRLEDYVEVMPTHGSGSLCGRGITGKRTTTIGYERRFNQALQFGDVQSFTGFVLDGNPAIPAWYSRMRPANVHGPEPWNPPRARPLTAHELDHLVGHGARVLDTRSSLAFAGGHIPGALHVALDDSFVTWAGWLAPSDAPLLLVLERDEDWDTIAVTLARIGMENIAGYLAGGMNAWIAADFAVETSTNITVGQLRDSLDRGDVCLLDVRMPSEWDAGHVPGARHIPLEQLPARGAELAAQEQPIAVICGSGYRSSAAASLLLGQGLESIVNVLGGMAAWEQAGYPTTRSGDGQ